MNSYNKFYKSTALLVLITGLILLIPLVAMQFTDEVVWSLSDFIIAGCLIFSTGFAYKLMTKNSSKMMYRAAIGVALAGALLLVWVNGAVGIIGNEDNPANLMYLGVIAIGIIGSLIARFKPKSMSITLFAMALFQVLVPVIALIIWSPQTTSWGDAGMIGVFFFNTCFAMLFATSAMLFRHVAQKAKETESEVERPA